MLRIPLVLALVLSCISLAATSVVGTQKEDPEVAYANVINQRAQKIVDTLEIDNELSSLRVRDLIAGQYRNLRDIHDARDEEIAQAKKAGAEIEGIQTTAKVAMFEVHRKFISRLSAELDGEQIDRVKDGMTYGVVPRTYEQYLKLLPDLKAEEKLEIKALLLEAREYAMDAGSSDAKHGWFRKYKGKINNFISKAGYDLKAAQSKAAQSP